VRALTSEQMEAWAHDFDSWDVCDQATTCLFDLTKHAWSKAADWSKREDEWVRRAGFALVAGLAVEPLHPTRALPQGVALAGVETSTQRRFITFRPGWKRS